jgi:hypothetical protein
MLCRTVLLSANGQHGLNPLVIKALGPLSHVGQAGNVTGYLACDLPVAERGQAAPCGVLKVYSAYINMKNQWVNEHTCFRVAKFPAFDA